MRTAMLALAFGLLVMAVKADEPAETTAAKSSTTTALEKPIDTEAPLSIYNNQLRCFKFKIDHAVVTVEEAAAFTVRYRGKDNPEIIGAYPDDKTNSLCVIAAPEAEQAIRTSLATRIIELQGIPGSPLTLQQRELEADRAELLSDLAQLEMALVDIDEANGSQKVIDIRGRMDAFEAEVAGSERKIAILKKYMKRIQELPE